MTENNYLTASDLSKSDTIRRLIDEKTPHVLCFFPGTLLQAGELQICVLVVTGGGPEQILSLLGDDHLPEYTPILYLGEGDCIPEPLNKFAATRIIDYLPLPSSLLIFLEKTKTSALASLQLLAKNIAGSAHQHHIDKVSHYVALLGEQLGLPEQHTRTFQNSITLYNSFRFLLHNDLLSKPERLTQEEHKIIEDLPFKLHELTDMFDYFTEERNVLLGHNERYDGTGYPLGLKGDEISLGSRIFNIVDSLAAMNSERPYRRKLTPTEIIDELKKEAGKQFDPYLVLQILAVIKKNNLLPLDTDFLDQTQQDLVNIFPQLIS